MALIKAGFEVYGIDLNTEYLKKYLSQSWVERLKIKHVAFEHEPIPFPMPSSNTWFLPRY